VWVILLTGVFIYGRIGVDLETAYNGSQRNFPHPPSYSSDRETINSETLNGKPYIGGYLSGLSKPEQMVKYFIESINSDDLDAAVSIVEPNYFLKHLNLENDFFELVRLWEPGEVNKYKIEIGNINVIPLPCSITLTLNDGRTVYYEFELVELTNFEVSPPIKDWYIQKIKDTD